MGYFCAIYFFLFFPFGLLLTGSSKMPVLRYVTSCWEWRQSDCLILTAVTMHPWLWPPPLLLSPLFHCQKSFPVKLRMATVCGQISFNISALAPHSNPSLHFTRHHYYSQQQATSGCQIIHSAYCTRMCFEGCLHQDSLSFFLPFFVGHPEATWAECCPSI